MPGLGQPRRKVRLPGYPFERQRYWIEAEQPGPQNVKKPDIADWFYRQVWESAELGSEPSHASWVVIGGQRIGELVALRLRGEHREEIGNLDGVRNVVHLGSLSPSDKQGVERFRERQEQGYWKVLEIARLKSEGELVVVSWDEAEQGTLTGLAKVIGQEKVWLRVRVVEMDSASSRRRRADRIAAECSKGRDKIVRWRGGERLVERYRPERLVNWGELRERGIYLITGAFGKVGLALAEHLARQCRARLILLGRRGGAGHESDIVKIEAAGGEVLALACDVSNQLQMTAVLDAVHERWGRIHGAVHAAGISDWKVLEDLTRDGVEKHFQAKPEGLYVLE